MVSHHPAKFGGHSRCCSGDMVLVVEEQEPTCLFNSTIPPIEAHGMPSSQKRNSTIKTTLSKTFDLNITHMWGTWGTPQNFFFFCIFWLTWKTNIKKNWWNGPIKNDQFNIFNDAFKKIYKEKHWRYHYQNQFLRYRAKQTGIGKFGSFFALLSPSPLPHPKNPKN